MPVLYSLSLCLSISMPMDIDQSVYEGEIWQKSQCLEHEKRANLVIAERLKQMGFSTTDHFRIFRRGQQTAVVCLVDDILTCADTFDVPTLYDHNTIVITDNHVNCEIVYKIYKLPQSFFGIYNYAPASQHWNPDRDFSFAVNRIDHRRLYLMLDLARLTDLDFGYVNFNCRYRSSSALNDSAAFAHVWSELRCKDQAVFESSFQQLLPKMPLRNYTIDFDSTTTRSWLNIVLETYGSDNVVSLSEKIFRSLVTPAPWCVYSGRNTVSYLESLGFDCMRDLIDHSSYDSLFEKDNKLGNFISTNLSIIGRLKAQGIDYVRLRCCQAAQTNQRLLQKYSTTWLQDFNAWWHTVSKEIDQ